VSTAATIRPYGSWPSPISAAVVAAQGVRFGGVAVDGSDTYWIEGRPNEAGRNVLVRHRADGSTADVIPAGFNVRSRVHEYGGGAFAVARGNIYFSNFHDQRVYAVRAAAGSAGPAEAGHYDPIPITPEGKWFYADFAVDPLRPRLVCVREDHTADGEAVTTLVSLRLEGVDAGDVIASGYDFYSTPRFSPDGSRLCWLAWRHPDMPWDGTELWVADVAESGALADPRLIAGGGGESIYQPGWGPDGALYFASDRGGWWTLFRSDRSDRSDRSGRSGRSDCSEVLKNPPAESEFGRPQWVFGTATWVFVAPSRMLAAYTRRGQWYLADVNTETGEWARVSTDLEPHDWLAADAHAKSPRAVLVAGSATRAAAVVRLDVPSGGFDVLRASSSLDQHERDVSRPEPIEFGTAGGRTAHAMYYAPANAHYRGSPDERPPLIAISHGGPTTAATATLDLRIQYWTSRGFAVIDVNYRGSSGYGREYRNALRGNWGIADVEDMVHAARHLVAAGRADESRLIIRGGSAGGYTTLAALTFHAGTFTAGASYYGISDLEVLAQDTHKFEARYLDRLIGPYPEMRDTYRARSPIHFVDRLSCPLILFQGLEDRVVPPNQSEMMANAVRAKGLPVAYLTFAGEQHGFRKAQTIIQCLEAELDFYASVFGFHLK
jgi:dipeptidyl aminopeptidase/acylaminoacyl peptidase